MSKRKPAPPLRAAVREALAIHDMLWTPEPGRKSTEAALEDLLLDTIAKGMDAQAQQARAGRVAAAKAASAARRATLSPLQDAVRAALVLLGPDATHAAVVDALARRGYSHSVAAVSKARRALRQKGL